MMRVKNHHMMATVRVDIVLEKCCQMFILIIKTYFGKMSHPWHRKDPIPNHKALEIVHWLVADRSPSSSHSYGLILS